MNQNDNCKTYNEIIQMEVLLGIDRAFHSLQSRESPLSPKIKRDLVDNLKEFIPQYIESQADKIIFNDSFITIV